MNQKDTPLILLIDDDRSFREALSHQLRKAGYRVVGRESAESGIKRFGDGSVDLVITDIRLPGLSGVDVLFEVRQLVPDCPVIVMTAYGAVDVAVETMRKGAFDFLEKPFSGKHLLVVVERALMVRRLTLQNQRLRRRLSEGSDTGGIVAVSKAMQKILRVAERVSGSDTTVLLLGESGTGKDVLARAIHYSSERTEGPFIAVNCAAIPDGLVESELFGVERGGYTGAHADRAGRFELADAGTLFLDEVGEFPKEAQAKLLRVLEERQITRIGATKSTPVDVRIIAATKRDLEQEVKEGRFREDLFYRLAVLPITVPPLRCRTDDVPPLVHHFLKHLGGAGCLVTAEAMEALCRYPWPGNVRELANVIERSLVLREHPETLALDDLPSHVRLGDPSVGKLYPSTLPQDALPLETLEREIIERALAKHDGNQVKTARYLGLTRPTLIYRMKRHKIQTIL